MDGMCGKHGGVHKCDRIEFANTRDKEIQVLDECGRDNFQVLLKQKRPLIV
jgi:hypothetical protein